MANPNSLYSYKGAEPTVLPHRIILSNGSSRTDNTSFTDEEIADAGFTGPYQKPEYDSNTQRLVWNSETLSYFVENLPEPPKLTEEEIWGRLRMHRNHLLSTTDWMFTSDSVLSGEKQQEWIEYRQKLRDLPQNTTDIDNIIWPVIPE